ncbi:MAG: hypothetical protein P9X22_07160 [Candidatus Zapsychrus exili]|nr:hypothetical protein [Candidatus Zapsychrus exili]
MKLQIFLMAAIFSLFSIASLNAEPIPSVEWLMNEPASLFDIGMMRLRDLNKTVWIPKLVEQTNSLGLTLKNPGLGSGVVYDLEKNILSIGVYFIGNPTEQRCAEILKQYKAIIGHPKPLYLHPTTMCFGHINYSVTDYPKNIDDNILKIVKITVGISEKDHLRSKSIYCSSGLFEDTPSFTKYGF